MTKTALMVEARIRALEEEDNREQSVDDILSDIERRCSVTERQRLMRLLVWKLVGT